MGRLIDADVLIKEIRQHMVKINSLFEEEKTVVEIIEEQPTAYDVEKVAAELESKKSIIQIVDTETNQFINLISLDKAIDIVKRGGVE